jgi:hypothetical protein
MASGESFDDMITRVQTRRISNGQRGSRPGENLSAPAGDSAMFQKKSAATASPDATPISGGYRDTPVSPAVSLGGGKKPSKSFGGSRGFQKGGGSKFGGLSKGGGAANFRGGKR